MVATQSKMACRSVVNMEGEFRIVAYCECVPGFIVNFRSVGETQGCVRKRLYELK